MAAHAVSVSRAGSSSRAKSAEDWAGLAHLQAEDRSGLAQAHLGHLAEPGAVGAELPGEAEIGIDDQDVLRRPAHHRRDSVCSAVSASAGEVHPRPVADTPAVIIQ
ncbi:hypothetical protein ACFXKW_31930 [Streptomyces sp. NPDC059193]|uniref:hypothetical protein n=1 Tax=Streptomyces sp. NPDC059193 TaxID=3346763 RepID=UPI0036A22316